MKATTEYDKVIKRSIILCWIALALCFIVKICGGNFFAIAVENEKFIAVCEYIDNNQILLQSILFCNYYLTCFLYFNAVLRQIVFTKKQFLWFSLLFVFMFLLKLYDIIIGGIFEIIVMLAIPILSNRQKWFMSIVYVILYNVLGFVSVFVKNINKLIVPDYSLIGLIFSLDIYFMLILFMLYNYKKKEN